MAQTLPLGPDSRLYLVDGSAYIFRAFHVLDRHAGGSERFQKKDGTPTSAVFGFCNMLWKLVSDAHDAAQEEIGQPTHFAVVFDHSGESFRNALYDEYKANRSAPPEDLVPQFPLVRDATRAFGLPCLEMAGYEADDIIATHARLAEEKGAETVIVSSDKDLMQLITDRTVMFDPMKNRIIDRQAVIEKFGAGPERMIDMQALMGDSTDNVPGVPGIGPKTAAQLLEDYGSLDALLDRADEIKQKKRREMLIAHREDALLSRQLVTLDRHVPVEEAPEDLGLSPFDHAALVRFLEDEMEFNTLPKRIREAGGLEVPTTEASPAAVPIDQNGYEIIFDPKILRALMAEAEEHGIIAIDTETDNLEGMKANLCGISFSIVPGKAYYVPVGHGQTDLSLDDPEHSQQMSEATALDILKPVLLDPSILKVGQNLKYDLLILRERDIDVVGYDDTMLLSYAADCGFASLHGMDELSKRHLGHEPIPYKEIVGTGKKQKTFGDVPIKDAYIYAAEDADVTLRLHTILKSRAIESQVYTVYETMDRPLVSVITDMERAGIKVDRDRLSALSGEFAQRMAAHEAAVHDIAGERFNLASPKQIGDILFGKLGLPGGKKTKTGAWSTAADTLETLAADGAEIAQEILSHRGLAKLKGTYTDALSESIHPKTGRVHTSFSLASTTTGRLSSNDPNLQNIPIRTEDGRKIREAFIPEDGNVLISADYSQIELRLLAHIAEIGPLIEAFHQGLDIHAMTAAEVFGVPLEGMDPSIRRQAKAINFGIIYGISAFGLARNLGIGRDEASLFIKRYFERFPGIKAYMDETIEGARVHGYVETLFGRRSHTPNIKAKQPNIRMGAERQAINAPIQGSAADIVKRAMIRVPAALAAHRLSAKMLLQVHDELVVECPADQADETAAVLKDVMEGAAGPALSLSVPLVVEAGQGASWEQAH
ncbi:DNA polymerase I [Parvularcula bermudensis HTCC2503]|uniref:DNA polymerase I n=1 Tax=Parvularcula bermudensis (strain ATCC BAA-594 / HTCC2503 / KCTC 12087) TaxID=314260 RepID=E0TER0_PARBH|nr:DNA polymerase I [Parvularcula bermudensis]ADM08943.1 DNA polymerase I [Parvularcula bermudensis HTCC2503]